MSRHDLIVLAGIGPVCPFARVSGLGNFDSSIDLYPFRPDAGEPLALLAVQGVAESLASERHSRETNPLYLHGPPGTGKTHLVSALIEEATRRSPRQVVTFLQAGDLDALPEARHSDLFILEDLQHLKARPGLSETLVQIVDALQVRQRQMIFTATVGPGQLTSLPNRLTSRLGGGLVVRLEPLSAAGRLVLLQDKAQRRQLAVSRDVLAWLAEHLTGGGRQLEGALLRLETLARMQSRPLDVATVAAHFQEEVEAGRPTVERIAQRVGTYFRIDPRHLQSRRRSHRVMLPRQVGMYLARQLTGLSLDQIGDYFGGRDHSTVLYACRKIEQALSQDVVLSGAVQQLHRDLI